MPRFLDTNILLLYLTGDDQAKAQACLALLFKVERGEEVVVTTNAVISETVFTLQSPRQYRLPRDRIRELVEPIIAMRGLRLPEKALYARAFELYCDKKISFAYAFNAAYIEANGISEVYSYDRDFDRLEGIKRVEPEE